MHVPLLGLILALLAFPLMSVFPELGQTGQHVEIGFAWIQLKSVAAWVAFLVYFSVLFGGVFGLSGVVRKKLARLSG